jgi:hypothetical protein
MEPREFGLLRSTEFSHRLLINHCIAILDTQVSRTFGELGITLEFEITDE